MKKLFFIAMALFSSELFASNYPPNYCYQNVRLKQEGPVVFATVGSGCGSAFIIGYKQSGYLSDFEPNEIDVIVVATCKARDGSRVSKESVVKIGKEWHGNGYLSAETPTWKFTPSACDYHVSPARYEFAFSDGNGHWDSKGGANYRLDSLDLYQGQGIETFATNEAGTGINLKAWAFIVEKLGE